MGKFQIEITDSITNHKIKLAENQLNQIWRDILLYAEPPLLRKYWKHPDLTDALTTHVTTSIKQAYEYYQASESTSIHTKPLLLYYSVLNLTKAVLTIVNDKLCSNYHGLQGSTENDDLSAITAKSNRGVFSELAETLKAPWAHSVGKSFSFDDFASHCIETFSSSSLTNPSSLQHFTPF